MNIPDGRYAAVGVPQSYDDGEPERYAQLGQSKEKKTDQVTITFKILDGEAEGQQIAWTGYFTADTYAKTVEALRNCGFKGDDLLKLHDQTLDQEVSLVIESEEYKGKMYPRVRWVNRPGGGGGMRGATPMKGDELRKFAAMMKARVKGIPEVAGERPAPKVEPPLEDGFAKPKNGDVGEPAPWDR
jgi:hypothetical protein